MDKCGLLHIEDDDSVAFLFRAALDEAQITVSVYRVSSAEAALQFLCKLHPYERAKTPRLILLDLTLPGRDGWWLLAEAQKNDELRSIPIVVMGTESVLKSGEKALNAGATLYIEKPFEWYLLVERVKYAFSLGLVNL